MMMNTFPTRREMKRRAKSVLVHPVCMRLSLLVVGLQMAMYGLKYLADGTIGYYIASLAEYGQTASGVYFTDNGLSLIFRMDLTQMVLAIPLTYHQILLFVVLNLLFFALLAPFRVGAMAGYWGVLRGGQPIVKDVFRWFQPDRFGKVLAVEFLLRVVVRAVGVVASVPSIYLFYLFYKTTPDMASYTNASSMLQLAATVLAVAAALFAFWLHCAILPVRYALAAHPEYRLGEVFRRGLASVRGYRGRFFGFRLSYFLWFFVSQLTYGVLDLFVLPYTSLGSMVFLQEAAKDRKRRGDGRDGEEPPAIDAP